MLLKSPTYYLLASGPGCVFTVANQSKSGLSVKCTASEAGGLIVHYSLYILMVSSVHY